MSREEVNRRLAALTPRYLEKSGGGYDDSYHPNIEGLLHTQHGPKASMIVEGLIHYFRTRIASDSSYWSFTWGDVKAKVPGISETDFALVDYAIMVCSMQSSGGGGPCEDDSYRWVRPGDMEELVECDDIAAFVKYRRSKVHAKTTEPSAVENEEPWDGAQAPSETLLRCTACATRANSGVGFVKDSNLREIAQRNLRLLVRPRPLDEVILALALAGSVIECVLVDVVEFDIAASTQAARRLKDAPKVTDADWRNLDPGGTKRWNLRTLIGVCGPDGLAVLSAKTLGDADRVRGLRNRLHPREEREEGLVLPLGPEDAHIADALAAAVMRDVENWWSGK